MVGAKRLGGGGGWRCQGLGSSVSPVFVTLTAALASDDPHFEDPVLPPQHDDDDRGGGDDDDDDDDDDNRCNTAFTPQRQRVSWAGFTR
eukprot:2854276-Rhodomonas_salina.2